MKKYSLYSLCVFALAILCGVSALAGCPLVDVSDPASLAALALMGGLITEFNDVSEISGIQAGPSKATVKMSVGKVSYEELVLNLAGTFAKTDISNIELLGNSKPLQRFVSVADLELIRSYYAEDVVANEVVFSLIRRHLVNPMDAEAFAMGVADLSSLNLAFDIGASATAPQLSVKSDVTQYNYKNRGSVHEQNALGVFNKIRWHTKQLTGAGTTVISDLPREGFLMALHFLPVSNYITAVEIECDGKVIWKGTATEMANKVNRYGRVRQAGCYHCDWTLKGKLGDEPFLPGFQSVVIRVTHSNTTALTYYSEMRSGIGGI